MSHIIRKHYEFSNMESDCDISLRFILNQGIFTKFFLLLDKKKIAPALRN